MAINFGLSVRFPTADSKWNYGAAEFIKRGRHATRATAALQRGSGKEISSGANRNVARSNNWDLDDRGRGLLLKEATVDDPRGAVFQPEIIELMKAVLDDAIAMLPEAKRTSTVKAEIASGILACAAKGERNPAALKTAALLSVVDCSHYSHDISPERRAV
jgi:hypothetical protein